MERDGDLISLHRQYFSIGESKRNRGYSVGQYTMVRTEALEMRMKGLTKEEMVQQVRY